MARGEENHLRDFVALGIGRITEGKIAGQNRVRHQLNKSATRKCRITIGSVNQTLHGCGLGEMIFEINQHRLFDPEVVSEKNR